MSADDWLRTVSGQARAGPRGRYTGGMYQMPVVPSRAARRLGFRVDQGGWSCVTITNVNNDLILENNF